MTTPVLNRRVTVHGTSTVTRLQPNFYPFEDYGVPPGGNRWGSGYGLEAPYVFLELPAMVSGFADINWNYQRVYDLRFPRRATDGLSPSQHARNWTHLPDTTNRRGVNDCGVMGADFPWAGSS